VKWAGKYRVGHTSECHTTCFFLIGYSVQVTRVYTLLEMTLTGVHDLLSERTVVFLVSLHTQQQFVVYSAAVLSLYIHINATVAADRMEHR